MQKVYDTSKAEISKNFYASSKDYTAKQENGVLHINKSTDPQKTGQLKFFINSMSVKKGVKYKFTLSVIYATQGSIDIVAFTNPMKIIGVSYKPTFLAQQKLAADRGVNFVSVGLPLMWDEDKRDIYIGIYDRLLENLIKTNPNVRIFPRTVRRLVCEK